MDNTKPLVTNSCDKKMKILFDINHPVDINFFKNAIVQLKLKGYEIFIAYRGRNNLEKILKYELRDMHITCIGHHHKTFLSKIFFQLYRDLLISRFLIKNRINLVVCFGATSAIAAKIMKVPYLAFDDDYEYKIPFYHANWFSTKHIYPDYIPYENKNTNRYHGFKELAYLHPNHLKLDENVLKEYDLIKDEYVFIREIAPTSLNYRIVDSILQEIIKLIKYKGYKIVLSLEDKSQNYKYKNDCIILDEPVKDIYSLMHYSLFAISSGDSVARETSLLGVPTIYTGGRKMSINSALLELGILSDIRNMKYIKFFIEKCNSDEKYKMRERVFEFIQSEWVDTTQVILDQIYQVNNEK